MAQRPITRWLSRAPTAAFGLYAIAAAFLTYFSMYAFRKPFAAGAYPHAFTLIPGVEMSLKDVLIISQVLGYALSKWLGVKFVTELPAKRRAAGLVVLILVAEAALVLFAVLPTNFKMFALFLNGLPLGAVWGLVFGFLEGRRTSEILGAGLSVSYIVASGAVKSVGMWVHQGLGISEWWMPAATGALFLPLFLLATWLLQQLPPPSAEDVAARTAREPMDGAQRRAFIAKFTLGLLALTALYFFLTAYRDFRDNYAVDLYRELNITDKAVLTTAELPIALGVLLALAFLYRVKDHKLGLLAAHGIMLVGVVLVGVSTLIFDAGIVDGLTWMILVGLGLYLAYVPYGCVLFDRMIASLGVVATAVFMIYVTDAAGYAGSIGIILFKHFGSDLSPLNFFRGFSYFTSVFCTASFTVSAVYFWRKSSQHQAVT